MLKTIARALRCFDVDVQKRMVQHTAEEWLQREDAAKRKRAVEEAKAKPYAENYRYLVALQEGYVMVASKSEALILQELVALECRWNTSRRSRSREDVQRRLPGKKQEP
ncbi:MAG: hypothetical protein ACLR23_26900 [Clostridia bacterium]